MRNACSRAPGPADAPAVSLLTVWDVDEDGAYDVHKTPEPTGFLIAIRTLEGAGRILLGPGHEHSLKANTLLVVERNDILRYRSDGPRWKFWWFEFNAAGNLRLPLGDVLHIPPHKTDASDFRTIFAMLARPRSHQRAVASAMFGTLLHRWAAHWKGTETETHHPRQAAIEAVIDAMPDRLQAGWAVSEMAKAAHMSERAFRNAFHSVTGCPPKTYFDRLRLSMARELLKLGALNVSEIAYRFGFSSPFHFSKAFKAFAGAVPSSFLPTPPRQRR